MFLESEFDTDLTNTERELEIGKDVNSSWSQLYSENETLSENSGVI